MLLHNVDISVIILLLCQLLSAKRLDQIPLHTTKSNSTSIRRVAIIGAGAAGSSTAYHLNKFCNATSGCDGIKIDIFETNSYIGGRTTTVNALDDPRYTIELGASIFVKVNHILYNLSSEFDLLAQEKIYASTGSKYSFGIWDGSSFILTIDNVDTSTFLGRLKSWWGIIKILWKYGLSPLRTIWAKDKVVGMFTEWYDDYFPIASLTNFAEAVGLSEYTGILGQAALYKNGVSESYAHDVVQSSTRVNYAQNLNNIHGLETMVCMATDGAMSVDGGNWQIFAEAVKRSGATVHLNTSVTEVFTTEAGKYQIQTTNTTASTYHDSSKLYDSVILAAPYQYANITFTPSLPEDTAPQHVDYVTLYVTLFVTSYLPFPGYFNVDSQDLVPDSILTTNPLALDLDPDDSNATITPRGTAAVGPSEFWSLSTLRIINPSTDSFPAGFSDEEILAASKLPHNIRRPRKSRSSKSTTTSTTTTKNRVSTTDDGDDDDDDGEQLYIYKIFSPSPINATYLTSLFDFDLDDDESLSLFSSPSSSSSFTPISSIPTSIIPWSHTKTWRSYPYLPPTLKFPSILISSPYGSDYITDFNNQTQVGTNSTTKNARGIWYTSGVETFISTMETSALMGMNVARVIVDGISAGGHTTGEEMEVEVEVEVEVERKERGSWVEEEL